MPSRRTDAATRLASPLRTAATRTAAWRPATAIAITAALTLGLLGAAPTPANAKNACSLTGSGTSASPYLVATADDLAQVGSLCGLASAYRQTANITLVAPAAGSSNHTPIGEHSRAFTGRYDGAGWTITGLAIDTHGAAGLFGATNAATLDDIHLVGVTVIGYYDAGALVGESQIGDYITNSSATGTVSGNTSVGGLVGSLSPTSILAYSRASVRVEGARNVGGLIGLSNQATVENSYATGDVLASGSFAGALVGVVEASAIATSYAKGTVTYTGGGSQPATVGGLNGEVTGTPAPASSYYTDATLTDITTFTGWAVASGWNTFNPSGTPSRVWGMCAQANSGTPFLLWEYTSNPCPTAKATTAKKTVYFKGNSAKLTTAAKKSLRSLYATATTGTPTKLKVTGVVNTRSYSLFTKRLAQARASAVVSYLKKLGYTGTVTKATGKATKGAKSRKADVTFTYTVTPT